MKEEWELGLKFLFASQGCGFENPESETCRKLGQQSFDFFVRRLKEKWGSPIEDWEAKAISAALLESIVVVRK